VLKIDYKTTSPSSLKVSGTLEFKFGCSLEIKLRLLLASLFQLVSRRGQNKYS